MGYRAKASSVVVLICAFLALAVAPAMAAKTTVATLGGATSGIAGGTFSTPRGVAINQGGSGGVAAGTFYVVDSGNNRIQQFDPSGAFVRAWGYGVKDGAAEPEFCTVAAKCARGIGGAGAGQVNAPQGIAVDPATGNLYVSDQSNRRIDVFGPTGTFQGAFGWGARTGAAELQFCTTLTGCHAPGTAAPSSGTVAGGQFGSAMGGLAVDASGNVYFANKTSRRVDVFQPTMSGTVVSGVSFLRAFGWGVATGAAQFEVCTTAATCKAPAAAGTAAGQFASTSPSEVAIDSEGNLFALDAGNKRVQVFNSTPEPTASAFGAAALSAALGPGATQALAIDASDHVYVAGASSTAGGNARVVELDHTGAGVAVHGADLGSATSTGLAVARAALGGNVFLSAAGTAAQVSVLNDTAPTVAVPSPIGPHEATFHGTVVSAEMAATYRFEYSADEGATWTRLPAVDASVAATPGSVPVEAQATGLDANASYLVRLVATRPAGGFALTTAPVAFTTTGAAPVPSEAGVDSVQDVSARLVGLLDPEGQATSFHFEYVDDASFQAHGFAGATRAPVPDGTVGEGHEPVFVAVPVSGLSAATTYHFRLVASNASGQAVGSATTFTTRVLPLSTEGRAYELVSPAVKPGGQGVGIYTAGGDADAYPGLASADGERYMVLSFAGNLTPGKFLYSTDWAKLERTPAGWVSHSPYTHPEYSKIGGTVTFLDPTAVSENFNTIAWAASMAHIFPEMSSWPGLTRASYESDWQGRWQLINSTDPDADQESMLDLTTISADGSHVVLQTLARGQLGSSDPSLDQLPMTWAVYDNETAGGFSDQFTPNGTPQLAGTCTGAGSSRTLLPSIDGSGNIAARQCPPAAPGRDGALLDPRGAVVAGAPFNGTVTTAGSISADGSRLFLMSPDPSAFESPTTCSGTGESTECPTQLYVRQLGADGKATVRWIGRSQVPGQAGSLMGPAYFEGASRTGDKVFLRTDSPLTANDPNGTGAAPVTTGSADPTSWDLYEYDVPSDAAGHPGAGDPGNGTLTRISAGPEGTGDCNVSEAGTSAALRFSSEDGTRLYFTCMAPLPGVPTNSAPTDGTTTTAGGSVDSTSTTNLYYYDAHKPLAERWEFVAQLPDSGPGQTECATRFAQPGQPMMISGLGSQIGNSQESNCVKGTADGTFITFMTPAPLVAGDDGAGTVDVYAFDASSDRLIRIDAPQGGSGGSYPCEGSFESPSAYCNGDLGYSQTFGSMLGVATKPAVAGDRIAFFQSKAQLVPGDVNDQYDVYEWHNGRLSLISAGTGDKGSYYAGNGADGRDVFIETRDRLTWQDFDGVMDVYDARVGGGIPEPAVGTPACGVLAGGCQAPPGAPAAATSPGSAAVVGPGNEKPAPKPKPKKKKHKAKKKHKQGAKKKHGKTTKKHKTSKNAEQSRRGARTAGNDRRASR